MTARWRFADEPDPRPDHHYAVACWLLGRHPTLDRLARRIPGLVTVDQDGADKGRYLTLSRELLASVFNCSDQYTALWQDYERHNPAPYGPSEAAYDRWEAAGPPLDDVITAARARAHYDADVATAGQVGALRVMSGGEQARLRLLAVCGDDRVGLRLDDLRGLDPAGERLVADWCRAVQVA